MRIATALLGAFFTLQGLGWLAIPARAAAGLGMPLLDGVARSTQIGDLTSFFVVAGLLMLGGSRPGHARLLAIPGLMLGVAAIGRILAWALHGAAFATTFIAIEIAVCALLFTASRQESV